jgi:ankyrin repeat protein
MSFEQLMNACQNGHIDVVNQLIDVKVDVNAYDMCSRTPLTFACQNGHMNVVNHLIEAKANVNARDDDQSYGGGRTPLMNICTGGRHRRNSVVTKLIDSKADVNVCDNGGMTSLTWACFRSYIGGVDRLIDAKADVNAHDFGGYTPLMAACVYGHHDVIDDDHHVVINRLIDAKADVNAHDNLGNTPLMEACWAGHIGAINRLIDAKADVNASNNMGMTPLKSACQEGHNDAVNRLLQFDDIDIDIENTHLRDIIKNFKPRENTDQDWFINLTETHIDFLGLYCEVTGETHHVLTKRAQTIADALDHFIIPDLIQIVNGYGHRGLLNKNIKCGTKLNNTSAHIF